MQTAFLKTRYVVKANVAYLPVLFLELEEALFGLPVSIQYATRLIFEEAYVNIATHARREDGTECSVAVTLQYDKNGVLLTLMDDGKDFNPLEFKHQDALKQTTAGGFGIFLMKEYSDRILYARKNDRNILQAFIKSQ